MLFPREMSYLCPKFTNTPVFVRLGQRVFFDKTERKGLILEKKRVLFSIFVSPRFSLPPKDFHPM
jgi:hypothetical protein